MSVGTSAAAVGLVARHSSPDSRDERSVASAQQRGDLPGVAPQSTGQPNASSAENTGAALPRVPTRGAYLGAVPNPAKGQPTAQQVRALEQSVGRPLGIAMFYISFDSPPPLTGMVEVANAGSIPMVSMHCGPADAAIAAGRYDGLLRADAEAYRAYGQPVLLRWFWEMNLPNEGVHPQCLGTSSKPAAAADYVAAWKRIWTIFHETGATNVAFVWAPSDALHAPSPAAFYPGSSYVNWIAADLYDRAGYGSFEQMYSGFYSAWASKGPPLMLSETGAVGSAAQVAWIDDIAASVPAHFPRLHAVVYTDASNPLGDYVLQPGSAGMAAFVALGRTPYFSELR